jgi:gluconokinase
VHYFLGIDIGTTHTKAVILTAGGQIIFEAKKGYDLLQPQPGFEEQEVEVILDAVIEVIQKALPAIPKEDKIIAVGFSAAMHSVLPVDASGKPLYNAIIWADTRSKKEAWLILQHPDSRTIYQNTGIPIHPMSPLCKIVWFKNQRPEIYQQTAKFISIKEYVFSRLFGKYIVDYSIASATGLFNIHNKKWEPAALDVAGISEEKLSVPVSTLHEEHDLLPAYKELFQLKGNIPFIIGASDGCLANLGSGAIDHGDTALTIGTSGAVRMTVHEPVRYGNERLFTYLLADDIYVRGGAINNGGIVLKWLAELFLWKDDPSSTDYEALLSMATKVAPGADGLLFLPYLLGERAPVWDADAKGVLSGLTTKHKKEHIIRAALEGISFTLYQVITELEAVYGPVNEIYVSGGFVKSVFWVQLIADVMGKRLKVTETTDASAMGAAYLAMYATGFLKELSSVKQFTPVSQTYEPDPVNHRTYIERFQFFNLLYPKLKDDFAALSRLQEN